MVVILIGAAMLALVALAFKFFWNDILSFIETVIDKLVEISRAFIKFVRRNGKAVAYIVRHYFSGRRTKEEIDEIDIELCPNEVQDALNEGKEVLVRNIK